MTGQEDAREAARTRSKDVEELATIAVDRGLHVHKALGPGLLESIHETVLADTLERQWLAGQPLGLLMNFGAATFEEGLHRIANNHASIASSRLRVTQ